MLSKILLWLVRLALVLILLIDVLMAAGATKALMTGGVEGVHLWILSIGTMADEQGQIIFSPPHWSYIRFVFLCVFLGVGTYALARLARVLKQRQYHA